MCVGCRQNFKSVTIWRPRMTTGRPLAQTSRTPPTSAIIMMSAKMESSCRTLLHYVILMKLLFSFTITYRQLEGKQGQLCFMLPEQRSGGCVMRYMIRRGLFCCADGSWSQRRVKPGSAHSFHFLYISIWANMRVTWQCTVGAFVTRMRAEREDTHVTVKSLQCADGQGGACEGKPLKRERERDCWCGFSTITIPGNRGQAFSSAAYSVCVCVWHALTHCLCLQHHAIILLYHMSSMHDTHVHSLACYT